MIFIFLHNDFFIDFRSSITAQLKFSNDTTLILQFCASNQFNRETISNRRIKCEFYLNLCRYARI
jgi:hypothetical protein